MTRHLGFDVSSKTIGWSYFEILNDSIDKIKHGYIKPTHNNEIEDLFSLKQTIKKTFSKFSKKTIAPPYIAIEEFPYFITGGKSTARTITKLAIYTRITALSLYEIFDISPIFYPVATIRATIKKIVNNKDLSKEDIPTAVQSIINRYNQKWKFPVILNKKNNISDETYDIADSFAVNFTHIYKTSSLKGL